MSRNDSPSATFIVELMHGIRIGSEIGNRRKTINSLFPSEKISSAEVKQPSNERPIAASMKIKKIVKTDEAAMETLRKTVAEAIRVPMINVKRTKQ